MKNKHRNETPTLKLLLNRVGTEHLRTARHVQSHFPKILPILIYCASPNVGFVCRLSLSQKFVRTTELIEHLCLHRCHVGCVFAKKIKLIDTTKSVIKSRKCVDTHPKIHQTKMYILKTDVGEKVFRNMFLIQIAMKCFSVKSEIYNMKHYQMLFGLTIPGPVID